MENLKIGQRVKVHDPNTTKGGEKKGYISGVEQSMFDGQILYFVTLSNKQERTYCREALTIK